MFILSNGRILLTNILQQQLNNKRPPPLPLVGCMSIPHPVMTPNPNPSHAHFAIINRTNRFIQSSLYNYFFKALWPIYLIISDFYTESIICRSPIYYHQQQAVCQELTLFKDFSNFNTHNINKTQYTGHV